MLRKTLCVCATAVALALPLGSCANNAQTSAGGDARGDKAGAGAESFKQPFTDTEAYPVIVSSEIVVGENRFLVGLLDGDNDAPIASPDIDMEIEFFDLGRSAQKPVARSEMDFLWTLKPRLGLYVTTTRFESSGSWGAAVSITGEGIDETVKASFDVAEEPATPALGARPPASDTPTAGDVRNLSQISTDVKPIKRFYELSIAEALKSGRPSVITFATPKFCQTATCGPTLDIVKGVSDDFPTINFVHVEPYELPYDSSNPAPVRAAREWGLPTEPWVFVTDAKGALTSKFEGVVGAPELRAALEEL